MSYGYTITASCSSGQWSKAGSATVNENGSADYSHMGSGSYTASGSGSASSSGSGAGTGSGSGLPFQFQWSYSGSLSETAAENSSYHGTTQFGLASQGPWQATAGSLSASGSATWSYSASGDYWYDVGLSTVTGTLSEFAEDHMTYSYTTTDTAAAGV